MEQLDELQRSIVLSHAAGIGEYMDDATVRLMMVLKVNLAGPWLLRHPADGARGPDDPHQRRSLPVVPKKGSVGASGDLAPLAHMRAAC